MTKRNWTVLLIGGSSGIGKTRLAKKVSEIYKAKIIEADDVSSLIKATTKKEDYPAVHYWMGDSDWRQAGIDGNVKWLKDVSAEFVLPLESL
ncbi:hypothetical protein EZV73_00400 [Acidaminobacter sp. JC074]|uniref:hypothetical protein n=1 Tax=Acidaminobacter sp. JC074 TaxID=2530199 RepID=UPI001F0F515F|nr:hypothetical protein [Acidaminobacter sp. JC074]MCH4885999.1 hypothetical protein [Acidaminobacter sp. JC074]